MAYSVETPEYWQSFIITDDDMNRIEERFFEGGVPLSHNELADIVIQGRLAEAAAQQSLDQNVRLYQPKLSYEVGQQVRFPALHNAVGNIEAIRVGDNPTYGSYNVIQVRMSNGSRREFAVDYPAEHVLNIDETPKTNVNATANVGVVAKALAQRLAETSDYVSFGEFWSHKGLLPKVHIGHLNIAEAMIDVAGEAQTTSALVREVELTEGEPTARNFALNYALAHDTERRFVNVGTPAAPRWALRQGGAA